MEGVQGGRELESTDLRKGRQGDQVSGWCSGAGKGGNCQNDPQHPAGRLGTWGAPFARVEGVAGAVGEPLMDGILLLTPTT